MNNVIYQYLSLICILKLGVRLDLFILKTFLDDIAFFEFSRLICY